MKNLKDWLEFAIENQEGLKIEHGDLSFPEWNTGYLEANFKVAQGISEMWRTK